jgi:hypothetical protein
VLEGTLYFLQFFLQSHFDEHQWELGELRLMFAQQTLANNLEE